MNNQQTLMSVIRCYTYITDNYQRPKNNPATYIQTWCRQCLKEKYDKRIARLVKNKLGW